MERMDNKLKCKIYVWRQLMKDFCDFKKFINGKEVAVVGIGVSDIA